MKNTASAIIQRKSEVLPYLSKPVEIYKLENGHTIVIASKEGELVNVSTWVKTGSINENDEINGISHFLEHLMFKGTSKYPAGHFDRALESKGAIVNAATWKDYTFYYVTLPKGENNEHFTEALELHADMMLNPLFPEKEIGPVFDVKNPDVKEKRERYVVIEEIGMYEDQPWSKTYKELSRIMYTEHPYRRDVIGTAEIIASVSQDTIINYYNEWYTPENMTTIIVGDVDPDKTIALVREQFIFSRKNKNKNQNYQAEPEQTQQRIIENKSAINTGFALFGFHGPKASNNKESIALDVISAVLGEGKSSRLNQNLIEKPANPIFNVVGTGQYHFKDGNNFFVQSNFHPSQKNKAIELLKVELRNIVDSPISQEEFEKARKKLKARFAEEAETVSEVGESIGYFMTICNGDLSCYTDYLKALNTLTIEDIQESAKKYLDLNKVSISVLMPE